jgi:hydrogenase-4 component F
MTPGTLISILLLLVPGIASIFYFRNIRMATVAAAALDEILSVLLFWIMPPQGFFFVDRTTDVFIFMITSIYLLSSIYSLRYISDRNATGLKQPTYYLLLNLFAVSMLFSAQINNYGLMWVGIEATTISSALLIMTEKSEESLEATWRYIIIVSAGVTFAFISIILIYYSFGTLTVSTILSAGRTNTLFVRVAVSIALIGFGTKVGVFPVHTWLPDAHSEAPSPVSAMFSGVLLPTALYVLYRIFQIDPITSLFIWFGTISIVAASLFLGYQARYKRMFAYSTMENMNLALIGIATMNPLGIAGALYLLISHSFSKAGAFYSSGSVLRSTGTKDVANVKGIAKKMPITSAALLMSSLGVSGTPPFGTFFGEILILYSMVLVNAVPEFIIVVIFLVFAFVGINLNVSRMIFGSPGDNSEPGRLMPAVSLVASIVPLAIGAFFMVVNNAIL